MMVKRDTEDLDLCRWDSLQPPGGFFATSPWLRHAERTARVRPYYLIASDWRAAMPAYPLDGEDPYVLCRADHVLRQITGKTLPADGLMPVLACGARNPGYTFIASGPQAERSVVAEFIAESEELAREAGLKAVSYLYVHHADTALEQELAGTGYVALPGKTAYSLDVPPSFDDYLSRFPSHRRKEIRREIRLLAAAGVAYRVEPLTPDLAARLAPLEAQLFARYGTPGDERTLGAMMTSLAENLAGNAEVVLAELRGKICGFTVLLSAKNELYGRQTGYDYDMKGRLPVYFGVVFYEVVRLAQHRGIGTIYYGTGTGEAKLSRGCRPSPTRAWVKSLDPAAHDRLARLMVA
jgi:uncharacterized protein